MIATSLPWEGTGPSRRALMRAKSNIGPDWGGFEYTLSHRELAHYPGVLASHVFWGAKIERSARDVMAEAEGGNAGREPRDEAVEFLRTFLADGPAGVGEVRAAAAEQGIASRTLDRAKRRAGVVSKRQGFGKGSSCQWELQDAASYIAASTHTPPPETVALYGDSGGLRAEGKPSNDPLEANFGGA